MRSEMTSEAPRRPTSARRVRTPVAALIALLAAALLASACHRPQPSPTASPQPTEVSRRQGEGEELQQQRRQWYESLHRAAPGTDWRAIERANWQRHLERRNRRVAARDGARRGSSAWREVGSWNQAGRTHQVAYDAAAGRLFVGANRGGLWRGAFDAGDPDPGAMGWQPIGDGVYGTSHQVLLLAGPPETLLKTSAEAWSGEVHRSADGGLTWQLAAGTGGVRPRRLLKTGGTGETVFVLTDDPNQWSTQPSITRLLRSTDRGATFQEVRDLGGYRGDIWTPRDAEGPLYLLTDNRLEVSTDLGESWSELGSLPWSGDSRVALVASEAGAPHFYAVVERIGGSGGRWLMRSTDGGASWEATVAVDDFWGDLTSLAASIVDPDLVLYGGVDAWRSTDGGLTFNRINFWWEYYDSPADRLHADITSFDFVPLPGGGEALFISTDGGVYHSADGGGSVANLSLDGLRVSQYYSTLTPAGDPGRILAGSQDQGYQAGEATNGVFDQLISGDYGHLTSSEPEDRLVYSTYPGFILVAEETGADTALYSVDFPAGEVHQWLPFLLADPLAPEAFFFCATRIHRYVRSTVDQWTSSPLPFDFEDSPGEFVTALAIAPSDPDRWYAGTSLGNFWTSTDGGFGWALSAFDGAPAPHYLTGMAILVAAEDPDRVTIGGSGYSNPAVYRSLDGGENFVALGSDLPLTLVYDLAGDPLGNGDVYAATESGSYRYDAANDRWQSLLGVEAPLTVYWSVESLADRVRFGTYGRGVWDYRLDASEIFVDGFESGDTSRWSAATP